MDKKMIIFGTWRNSKLSDEEFRSLLKRVMDYGIFMIDTAESYDTGRSEKLVGETIKKEDRKKLLIITKVSPNHLSHNQVIKYAEESAKRLGTYIDVLLVHSPNPNIDLIETIKATQELKKKGVIKMFGLSNFSSYDINSVLNLGVSVVENELNLLYPDFDVLNFCKKHNLPFLAYRPLAGGELMKEPHKQFLESIGKDYNKSAAQVAIKWVEQMGAIPIIGVSNEEHLKEDIDLNWMLSKESINKLNNHFKKYWY